MTLLSDKELKELIDPVGADSDPSFTPLVGNLKKEGDWLEKTSPIQPSSVDLHVGGVFIPGVSFGSKGSQVNPHSRYSIKSGETAMVQAKEVVTLPSDIAGIGFPPSSIAVKGLLMTNPGHIDPGFRGYLSFTLINMSKKDFIISQGDAIFTILFFKLNSNVDANLAVRNSPRSVCGGVRQDNLDLLTKDFMGLKGLAIKQVLKYTGIGAAVLSAVAFLLSIGIQNVSNPKNSDFDKRLSALENNIYRTQINKLIVEVDVLEKKVLVLPSNLEKEESKKSLDSVELNEKNKKYEMDVKGIVLDIESLNKKISNTNSRLDKVRAVSD